VELALDAKRMPLENGNVPTRSSLSESGISNMEGFLETLMMVLPAIQVDMFDNKAQRPKAAEKDTSAPVVPVFELKIKKDGILAKAKLREGELVVLAGSEARRDWVGKGSLDSGYRKLRSILEDSNILDTSRSPAIFLADYAFSSPSAAAAVIAGRASNGRTEWKLKGTTKTYADWEAEQIEKDD
jgi:hypothetical protein